MEKIQKYMNLLAGIGFFGSGLWLGSIYPERFITYLGVVLLLFVSITAIIVSLIKK